MSGRSRALACLVACAATLGAAVHPDSLSSSRVTVSERSATVELRCQLASLVEVIHGLDADGDGVVSRSEFDAQRAALRGYVRDHYRLIAGAAEDLFGGAALEVEQFRATWLAPGDRQRLGRLDDGAAFEWKATSPDPIGDLVLEVTLFHDTSPDHVDLATVAFADGRVDSFGVMREAPRVRAGGPRRSVVTTFGRLGFDHILGGWDHLAFVALLVLGARSWRELFGLVTAFTVAHSITLAAASLGWIQVGVFGGYVEALIALSIAYVGCMNLFEHVKPGVRWAETLVFGLLHGLGFAGFVARSLLGESSRIAALASFNLGVELGQLLVVAALAILLSILRRRSPAADQPFAARGVRVVLSAFIAAIGLWWFVQRVA